MKYDKIKILEQELADIEHLEIGLLEVLEAQPVLPQDQAAPQQVNMPTTEKKQRLLQRIEALKALHRQNQ